ncbi:MAG: coproporphyrinogen III oxidase, partial [Primorskyibacter sp.]
DILYGLPHQTRARVTTSVQKLLSFAPDRVALYGYAHVPWMAKRQQMIPSDALPTPQERLDLFETARKLFLWDGYDEVGIDHFALPQDGLAVAQRAGTLRRNFQGYTDDTADVLIGVGASSISRFPQGFAQNDPRTSGYAQAVANGALPIVRGHVFAGQDRLRARMIEALMCDFRISTTEIHETFGIPVPELATWFARINRQFEGLLNVTEDGVFVPGPVRPLLRMIARELDAYDLSKAGHSSAI